MKKRNNKTIYSILLRYLILLAIVAFGLKLIYAIFTPLTIGFTVFLLDLVYNLSSKGSLILIDNLTRIVIIPACVAGSAYLLLLILNLTIDMKKELRIKSILYSFLLLFVLNIIRIVILATLYHHQATYVEFTHAILWYGLSTLFVIAIWFQTVKKFKIKGIPFYSDYKTLTT
jgi:exosortase/archaeosortase family protein